MSIRSKIVLVFIPLLITPLLLTTVASTLSARNGVTAVATSFLRFKSEELTNYASGQWALLVENRLAGNAEFVNVAREAVAGFARGLIRSDTELIFAVDQDLQVVMSTGDLSLSEDETQEIRSLTELETDGWHSIRIGGVDRVAQTVRFEPFGWYILVTESQDTFYRSVNQILTQTAIILSATMAASLVLLLIFTNYITHPLRSVADTMQRIITTHDLSRRVEILYNDETGRVGHTFNKMIYEIDLLNEDLKEQMVNAVEAKKNEQKLRTMFQRYVPQNVIDQFFAKPEEMLVGQNRFLVVLFSDIRGFTAISESLGDPESLVQALNRYFDPMVDIIQKRHGGIVDKFIGDAIMAVFGAPVKRDDEAERSVAAALDMIDALPEVNAWLAERGQEPWRMGIGINYGYVTIGNIGSEQKLDYTVIGDTVNETSRLETATKQFGVPIIVSDRIRYYCERSKTIGVRFRFLGKFQFVGKTEKTPVYQPARALSDGETAGWDIYDRGVEAFQAESFDRAAARFQEVLKILPDDTPSRMMLTNARRWAGTKRLPDNWDITVMESK